MNNYKVFMPGIIHLDGPDASGKDTVRNLIIKQTDGQVLVIVRSYISQLVYNIIHNRHIDENYYIKRLVSDTLTDDMFFILFTDYDIAVKRFVEKNEQDINIKDYITHRNMFLSISEELISKYDLSANIKFVDTGYDKPIETCDNILTTYNTYKNRLY